jgi:phosphohistidine phosphatase
VSRQLLVLRHAKSAWPAGVADLDRPLGPRGERDCVSVGRYLARYGLLPDHVVASPARRTVDTATAVLGAAGCPVGVVTERALYGGDPVTALREVPETTSRLLVVGHEPELVDLIRLLCGADVRLPTAALALLELEAPWPLLPAGRSVLHLLVGPKLLGGAN